MKITKVEISNIRGIESVVIEPGVLTVITGENASGKTSVIAAIRAVFEGGYDGSLVRKGEKKGEVKLTLDDGVTIRRVINAEKETSELTIKSVDGRVIPAPKRFVEALASGFAFDPLAFLNAPARERAKYIERFVSVALTPEELKEAVREDWWDEVYDESESGFTNIARIRKVAYDRRSELNRKARDLEGTIRVLKEGVPSLNKEGVDWESEAREKREALTNATMALSIANSEVKGQAKAARDAAEAENVWARLQVTTEYERQLGLLNAWRDAEFTRVNQGKADKIAAANATEAEGLNKNDAQHGPLIEKARMEHERAKEDLALWHKATGAREQVRKQEDILRAQKQSALCLDLVIDRLDKLRLEKLEKIRERIPGIDMREGEVFIDDIEFDALNTQKRIGTALRIAAEGAGNLKLMIVDDMEHFDKANWNEFVEAVKASGFQLVVGKVVEEGPLKVEVV